MDARMLQSCIAVDGGGTRCRFVLIRDGLRFDWTGGSANVSTDFDAAKNTLSAGMSALAEQAQLSIEVLYTLPAFVGVAGVTGPELIARLSRELPYTRAQYADDRPASVRGALGEADGLIAHCGTGSFFAAQRNGELHLTGGWGSILGDEASAMWIGKRLLSWVLRCEDGLVEHSHLSRSCLKEFGDTAEIVRFAGEAGPSDFGALAPRITEAFAASDAVAMKLMGDAAGCVAEELTALGWKPGDPLCLTGGIGEYYGALLPEEMRTDLRAPQGHPIDGAVALAEQLASEVQP